LPGGELTAVNISPVTKSAVFIDLATHSALPNGKIAEKWEGLTIGPRLRDGSYLILTGNDNDYSVTQNASNVQFDVYVDFNGNSMLRDIDRPELLNGVNVGPVRCPPATRWCPACCTPTKPRPRTWKATSNPTEKRRSGKTHNPNNSG